MTTRSKIFHIFIFDLTVPGATVQQKFSQMFAERFLDMTIFFYIADIYQPLTCHTLVFKQSFVYANK